MKKVIIALFVFFIIFILIYLDLDVFKNNNVIDDIKIKVDLLSEKENNDFLFINESQKNSFFENFSENFVIEEVGNMNDSNNVNWWVNSGAFLYSADGTGKTIFGDLAKGNKWQIKYYNYNAKETDNGYHPQNIFRLVTKTKWQNFTEECYYKIDKYILSKDPHRMESNGLLLFNRYQDGNNLYYTGIRVDGTAVIKKKIKGAYFTMAQKPIIDGRYNRDTNPNLLPLHEWIGIRSKVENINQNQVKIKVYYRFVNDLEWKLALEVVDDGQTFGDETITSEGYAGIRTDFMDVEFDDYKIIKL